MKVLFACGVRQENTLAAAALHDTIEDALAENKSQLIIDIANLSRDVYTIVIELTHDEKETSKEKYLLSFERKSIESYCIKIADRYCNINDWLRDKPKYASKYAMKAQCLYDAYHIRKQEIALCFGKTVEQRIGNLVTLCEQVYVSAR